MAIRPILPSSLLKYAEPSYYDSFTNVYANASLRIGVIKQIYDNTKKFTLMSHGQERIFGVDESGKYWQDDTHSVKNSHRIWLKLPGLKGKKHNDNSMRQLTRDHKNIFAKLKNYKEYLSKEEITFIEQHSSGWMNKYKDAWNLIGK
jgi:hypothetical protein